MEIIGSGHKDNEDMGSRLFIELVENDIRCETHFDRLFQEDHVAVGSGKYTPVQLSIQLLDIIRIRSKEKKYKCISIPCHSASSCIMKILLNNRFRIENIDIYEPISSTCWYIYSQGNIKNVLVLCTPLTSKLAWHKHILADLYGISCVYISFPSLAKIIDNRGNYEKALKPLKDISVEMKEFIQNKCDAVVCGCTHYNKVLTNIKSILKDYNFNGEILDSNQLLVNDIKMDNLFK